MFFKPGRSMWLPAMLAAMILCASYPITAGAQRWDDHRPGWHHDSHDRNAWERERERKRRGDAKRDGVVAGVVGAAVVVGIVAAVASARKDKREQYCRDRYGNYDRESDGYRASDGRLYPCH